MLARMGSEAAGARDDRRRSPNMHDVARVAGVSLGTVSHALNKPHLVSDAARARVEAAIAELGYVRNRTARSLVAGDSATVGFVLVDLANSLFVDIARGAEDATRQRGMALLLANADVDRDRQDRYLRLFDETRVSGILLAPLDAPLDAAATVREHGRPVVLVNYEADGYCGVIVDEEHGGYLAARHLLELGRTRLAFVGGPLTLKALDGRLRGARRAVAEAGADVSLRHLPTDYLNPREGRRVAAEVAALDAVERPDGLVVAADSLAAACIQELTTHGIKVPVDISVTGYDDNHFAADSAIPLTTLRQPARDMGEAATALLMTEIAARGGHEHRTVVMRPELVVRDSTAVR